MSRGITSLLPDWLLQLVLATGAIGGAAILVMGIPTEEAGRETAETALQPPGESHMAVTVESADRREVVRTVEMTGTLVARDELLVSAEVQGVRIRELLADVGDAVEAGQVLVRLDDTSIRNRLSQNTAELAQAEAAIEQARAAVQEAEASAVEARKGLERARKLHSSGHLADEAFQARQTAGQVASARVNAQRQALRMSEAAKAGIEAEQREFERDLARTAVTAPSAGIVATRSVRVGQTVLEDAGPLFRIIKDGIVELEAEIADIRLHEVHAGQTAEIDLPGRAGTVQGTVRQVEPTVDVSSRLGKVRIAMPAMPFLRPGTFVTGRIETDRRMALMISRSAILMDDRGPYVLIVEDGTAMRRAVVLGNTRGEALEVVEGLATADVVVSRAGGLVHDGERVAPVGIASLPQDGPAETLR